MSQENNGYNCECENENHPEDYEGFLVHDVEGQYAKCIVGLNGSRRSIFVPNAFRHLTNQKIKSKK